MPSDRLERQLQELDSDAAVLADLFSGEYHPDTVETPEYGSERIQEQFAAVRADAAAIAAAADDLGRRYDEQ